jgi:hypothetical protein
MREDTIVRACRLFTAASPEGGLAEWDDLLVYSSLPRRLEAELAVN